MLDIRTVEANLCSKDPRSPLYADIFLPLDPEELAPVPRVDCWCDNCFSGCDTLAVEILRLKSEADESGDNMIEAALYAEHSPNV